jgi:hypothetical protein
MMSNAVQSRRIRMTLSPLQVFGKNSPVKLNATFCGGNISPTLTCCNAKRGRWHRAHRNGSLQKFPENILKKCGSPDHVLRRNMIAGKMGPDADERGINEITVVDFTCGSPPRSGGEAAPLSSGLQAASDAGNHHRRPARAGRRRNLAVVQDASDLAGQLALKRAVGHLAPE